MKLPSNPPEGKVYPGGEFMNRQVYYNIIYYIANIFYTGSKKRNKNNI